MRRTVALRSAEIRLSTSEYDYVYNSRCDSPPHPVFDALGNNASGSFPGLIERDR